MPLHVVFQCHRVANIHLIPIQFHLCTLVRQGILLYSVRTDNLMLRACATHGSDEPVGECQLQRHYTELTALNKIFHYCKSQVSLQLRIPKVISASHMLPCIIFTSYLEYYLGTVSFFCCWSLVMGTGLPDSSIPGYNVVGLKTSRVQLIQVLSALDKFRSGCSLTRVKFYINKKKNKNKII